MGVIWGIGVIGVNGPERERALTPITPITPRVRACRERRRWHAAGMSDSLEPHHSAMLPAGPEQAEREAELISLIRNKPARSLVRRSRALRDAREFRELSEEETRELFSIVEVFERFTADRVGWVIELARLRGSTFDETWRALDLHKARVRLA